MSKRKAAVAKELTGREFDALPAAEKERIFQELENETPEQRRANSRPLNSEERKRWERIKKKLGRPKIGKGAKVVSVSVEADLLKRMDAYAKGHGLKRSELIIQGVKSILRDGPLV